MIEYSTKTVSLLTSASLRQLQWWDEQGIVKPRLSRGKRMYTPEQLLEVKIVNWARWAPVFGGRYLVAVRPVLWALRRSLAAQPIVKRVPRLYMLTDGQRAYFETDYEKLLARLKKAQTGMSLVDLTELAMGAAEGKAA